MNLHVIIYMRTPHSCWWDRSTPATGNIKDIAMNGPFSAL